MPTFSYREKNVTISVRCGARCRAYHASSMGEGKGPPHNCAPARFLFFGLFPIPGVFPLSIRNSRLVQAGSPGPAEPSAPLLASPSPQSLLPPSGHANLARIFPVHRRLCWRRPPCKAFYLRWATPTWPGFFRSAGASVGVTLPAKPFTSVGPRQHGPDFPGPSAPLLASPSPQSLLPPSGHANMA